MKLPRPRFTMRQLMGAVAVAAVGMFVLMVLGPVALWVGQATIPLEFLILDASTGKPIADASIRLAEGSVDYETTSGLDGRATIVIDAHTGGRSGPFEFTRTVNYAWSLVITADHHQSVNEDLKSRTRDPAYHSGPAPPPIVVRLTPLDPDASTSSSVLKVNKVSGLRRCVKFIRSNALKLLR